MLFVTDKYIQMRDDSARAQVLVIAESLRPFLSLCDSRGEMVHDPVLVGVPVCEGVSVVWPPSFAQYGYHSVDLLQKDPGSGLWSLSISSGNDQIVCDQHACR
jgi:hypothetical protein